MATVTIQEAQANLPDLIHKLKPGDEVNLEVDVIAKYVERILDVRNTKS